MYALNRVTLVGRIGQDPEIRYLENSVAVGRFAIAYSESYKDRDGNWQKRDTEWYDIVVWRNLAERAKAELTKGKLVYVEGKLSARRWEDKDGNKRKTMEIVARDFRAFETPNTGGGGGGGKFPSISDDPFASRSNATTNNTSSTPAAKPAANTTEPANNFDDAPDDDLPF